MDSSRQKPQQFVALLRGVNVSGKKMVAMAVLRSLCTRMGWTEVQTYIQSGNLVFRTDGTSEELEAMIERAIERRFGFTVPVVVRSALEWSAFVKGNPFPQESRTDAGHVLLALSKKKPNPDAVPKLRRYAVKGEKLAQVDDALWIHFAGGAGASKLSPAVLDRLVGSSVTARNWRTVLKLQEMAPGGSVS
jgi:uncharacterized protein (DUF1697 family)